MDLNKQPGEIGRLFDGIAPHYDRMNRLMTFGQDQRWRRFLLERAAERHPRDLLDLATGTGDIAALARKRLGPDLRIVGLDLSPGMLSVAKKRFPSEGIHWIQGQAEGLPFEDQSFDVVVFGFLLRNVVDVEKTLREVHRVLRPGGRVVCLDTTPQDSHWLRPFIELFFKLVIPLLGYVLARDRQAYAYLSDSTRQWLPAQELSRVFEAAGFQGVSFRKMMWRSVAIHWGDKNGKDL